jgi:hypothetical protein
MGARPFALFDEPYIRAFVNLLLDSLNKVLNHRIISGDPLNVIYEELQEKII